MAHQLCALHKLWQASPLVRPSTPLQNALRSQCTSEWTMATASCWPHRAEASGHYLEDLCGSQFQGQCCCSSAPHPFFHPRQYALHCESRAEKVPTHPLHIWHGLFNLLAVLELQPVPEEGPIRHVVWKEPVELCNRGSVGCPWPDWQLCCRPPANHESAWLSKLGQETCGGHLIAWSLDCLPNRNILTQSNTCWEVSKATCWAATRAMLDISVNALHRCSVKPSQFVWPQSHVQRWRHVSSSCKHLMGKTNGGGRFPTAQRTFFFIPNRRFTKYSCVFLTSFGQRSVGTSRSARKLSAQNLVCKRWQLFPATLAALKLARTSAATSRLPRTRQSIHGISDVNENFKRTAAPSVSVVFRMHLRRSLRLCMTGCCASLCISRGKDCNVSSRWLCKYGPCMLFFPDGQRKIWDLLAKSWHSCWWQGHPRHHLRWVLQKDVMQCSICTQSQKESRSIAFETFLPTEESLKWKTWGSRATATAYWTWSRSLHTPCKFSNLHLANLDEKALICLMCFVCSPCCCCCCCCCKWLQRASEYELVVSIFARALLRSWNSEKNGKKSHVYLSTQSSRWFTSKQGNAFGKSH